MATECQKPPRTTVSTETAEGEMMPVTKRRKTRKGTQSCWECKRRKVRCTFAAPTSTVCDGCRSRQTRCIGQEFCDEPRSSRVGDGHGQAKNVAGPVDDLDDGDGQGAPARSASARRNQARDKDVQSTSPERGHQPGSDTVPSGCSVQSQLNGSFDEISGALLAVWPSENELDRITSIPVDLSVLFHGVVCMPYAEFFPTQITSPRQMLQVPPPGSHPVLIARRLLLLGTFLQGVQPKHSERLAGLSCGYGKIMSRAVNAASRLVSSNDELVTSLEGIECVMMESMFLNNSGNLRRAWTVNRRAMCLGQLLGLHNGTTSRHAFLDAGAKARIRPDYMWARLVFSDRYLSLMLGLPQCSSENIFANPAAMASRAPIERFERLMAVAGGLILQRNNTLNPSLDSTHKIDEMLKDAAALMPPKWWLPAPSPMHTGVQNNAEAFNETVRLMNHFTHRHLLVQLHLPYLLKTSSLDSRIDYSKLTAANASRAILSQFVPFRSSGAAAAYCRGVDFIVFIASTTLCLAHIEARRSQMISGGKGTGALHSLQHQRLSDRGLLEDTLGIMDAAAGRDGDTVAQRVSSILRPLLAIEHRSARGFDCETSACSRVDQHDTETLGATDGTGCLLQLHIPHFGTVQLKQGDVSLVDTQPAGSSLETSVVGRQDDGLLVTMENAAQPLGIAMSSAEPIDFEYHAVTPYTRPSDWNWTSETSSIDVRVAETTRVFVPGLTDGDDECTLQGVDASLFDSLTQSLTVQAEM